MTSNSTYSLLRAQPRVSLRDTVPLRAPFALYVEPTNICNFKCVYCPESFSDFEERSGGLHRLDLGAFERISDQVLELGGVKTLNLYMMGEPFVNKNLADFIRIAKRKKIADRVIITSNGSLLTEDASRRVIEAGLDFLRISIYGGDSEPFARKTQSKIPLDRVHRNVARFKALRDEMKGSTFLYVKMIDSGDAAENQHFLDLFSPIADEIVLEPVMNWNDPEEGNLAQVDREAMLQTALFQKKKNVCPFPFYTLVVHSDLRVSVCCVDWAKETVVGDLKTQTLAEVWRGERLREFQLAHLDRRRSEISACRNCTFLHTAPDNLDDLSAGEFLARINQAAVPQAAE
jgi:radical SAM protein with 4Fe4S-binding SPASM domain